jgi:hypothetical protein
MDDFAANVYVRFERVEGEMREGFRHVDADIRELRTELHSQGRELRVEVGSLRSELKGEIGELRTQMMRFGTGILVAVFAMGAASFFGGH